jgi:pentafunctional AROM polypeptide
VSQTSKHPDASVLLIGMRGAGKSYIGHMAASELEWEYLDADAFLEQRHGVTCKEYVHQNGWEAFRKTETAILLELLDRKAERTIISLGGGIVETPGARDVLKEYKTRRGSIVHISRDIKEIVHYLTEETARPAYGEDIEAVYDRRRPWFHECSSHEFVSLTKIGDEESRETRTQASVRTFFGHITGLIPNLVNLDTNRRSYFLSLTFPDLATQGLFLDDSAGPAIFAGIDAVELRVDLLSPSGPIKPTGGPSIEYVTQQLAFLRHFTNLPIIYTVRTVGQGGSFPDASEDRLFGLLDTGLRLGAEYIDVETTLPHARIHALAERKGSSRIIASYHDWSGKLSWNGPEVHAQYTLGAGLGDVIKIVGKANIVEDNFALRGFIQKISTSRLAKPIIAINMGAAGQLSRVLNTTLTPVTHPVLPVPAAPGQLSILQINSALHLIGQIQAKRFYLFGDPIGQSPSPTLHNTAFKTLGLPHKYDLYPSTTQSLEELKSIVHSPDFGGASVTIPLKLDIIPLLDTLSHAGRIIGAINTVVPVTKTDGRIELHGDNTDWIGIQRAILARSRRKWSLSDVGLIIGAGGTARAAIYALHELGFGKILIYNRTRETAKTVIAGFPISFNIHVLEDLKDLEKDSPAVIVGTVPASATTSDAKSDGLFLPNSLFSRPEGGIVVDLAYRPHMTPLLELAGRISSSLWQQVQGVEVLLEQGYEQFNLWTGSKPPVKIVEKAVLSFYHALPPV